MQDNGGGRGRERHRVLLQLASNQAYIQRLLLPHWAHVSAQVTKGLGTEVPANCDCVFHWGALCQRFNDASLQILMSSPSGSVSVTLSGNRASPIIKLKSVHWGLMQYDCFPSKRGKPEHRDRRHKGKMIEQGDASTSQRTPKAASKPPVVRGKAGKRFLLTALQWNDPCWHLDSWIFSLQK